MLLLKRKGLDIMIKNIKTKECLFCGAQMEECNEVSNPPIEIFVKGIDSHSYHAKQGLRCPKCGFVALFALKEDGR